MAMPGKPAKRSLLPGPGPRRKLLILGIIAVIGVFVLLTFTQNWGKATAQRDIKGAENAARACVANPRVAARQCEFAAREIGAALPELEQSDQQALTRQAQKTLGDVHLATGKYREAAELYTRRAAATPQQSAPYRDVALAYSMAGNHRAAERYARLAVQLQPDDWRAHAFHGRILARAGQRTAALAALRQALEFAPPGEQAAVRQAMEKLNPTLPEAHP